MVAKASTEDSARIVDFKMFDQSEPSFEVDFSTYLGRKKGQYVRAYCSFLPSSRFIKRATLDSASKVKDSAALMEILSSVCKVNPQENETAVLLGSGAQFEPDRPAGKELMFVGAKTAEIEEMQDRLLSLGVYPLRLEIGTLSMLASIRMVARAEGRKSPTLVLEVGEIQSFIYIVSEAGVDMTRNISFGMASMLPHVKAELGLADEAVARKILQANTFDFTEMAPVLLRRLVKELQASVGFYEVQTGAAIGQVFIGNLSSRFQWMGAHLARSMGLDVMTVACDRWAPVVGVELPENVDFSGVEPVMWNLFAFAGKYE